MRVENTTLSHMGLLMSNLIVHDPKVYKITENRHRVENISLALHRLGIIIRDEVTRLLSDLWRKPWIL